MKVCYDTFYDWARSKFGEENIKIRETAHGTEICTHSPWSEEAIGKTDHKYKLWMNPSGGKSKHPEKGSYRCWLTDKMGSLVQLVAELDRMTYEDAEIFLCGMSTLRTLELKVHEFFEKNSWQSTVAKTEAPKGPKQHLPFPPGTHLIDSLPNNHYIKQKAVEYLNRRKIPTEGLYVGVMGDYKERIIIPYYNENKELIFYNGRTLSDKENVLRYLKCKEVQSGEVLYMPEWPTRKSRIFVMEGEFDAKSLHLCGHYATACGGKVLSDVQIEILKSHEIVLAFDADNAGLKAIMEIGDMLKNDLGLSFYYLRPPLAYKDWNKFYATRGKETVNSYINSFLKPFDNFTSAKLKNSLV